MPVRELLRVGRADCAAGTLISSGEAQYQLVTGLLSTTAVEQGTLQFNCESPEFAQQVATLCGAQLEMVVTGLCACSFH